MRSLPRSGATCFRAVLRAELVDWIRHEVNQEHAVGHKLVEPRLLHINVAGRACAGPAAFRLDAWNGVADRGFHHGRAVFDFNGSFFAGMVDKVNFGHDRSCCRNTEDGPRQSYNGSIRTAPALGAKT